MPATVTTDRVRVAGVDIVLANIVMSGAKLFFLSPKLSGRYSCFKARYCQKKTMFFCKDSSPFFLKLSKCSPMAWSEEGKHVISRMLCIRGEKSRPDIEVLTRRQNKPLEFQSVINISE